MSLVSVIIPTYNSSAFIIETLESVANQTWNNLELIITDDFSEDETVAVCTKWLNKNKQRFVDSVILSSDKNTGISANANRGLNVAKGDWIKFLGADDTLILDCIQANISRIVSFPEIKVLFSQIAVYKGSITSGNLLKIIPDIPLDKEDILASDKGADSQYKMLLLSDRINFSPSVFINRETLISMKGFDERFKLLEDYPLWLNLTMNGYKLYFMDKVTVNYRQHSRAVNNNGNAYLINPNYFKSEEFRKVRTYPFLPIEIRLNQRYNWYASQIFRCKWFRLNNRLNGVLLSLLTIYLNPFRFFIWVRKRLGTKSKSHEFYI